MRNVVFRLARPLLRLLGRDERGAIGVLIAILLGGGVLIGMAALVIDVGQLYQNRAELQNGADAAALAVAKSCADGSCNTGAAPSMASLNASQLTGGTANVDLVCGSGTLGSCPASSGAMTDCPAAPTTLSYVDVHTSTKLSSGSTLLPPVFARALLGNSSYAGTNVKACAQAEWGPAQRATALGFTISVCQWDSLTSSGSPFGTEIAVVIKSSSGAKPCSGPAGQNVAGGFGWLASDSACTTDIDLSTQTTVSDPGNNVSQACRTAIQADVAAGTVVYVPIFDSTSGTGSNATYHLTGLAAFVLNGYQNLPGVHPDVVPSGMASACPGSNPCLFGYFTQALIPVTEIGTGTDYGATAIKLSG